MFDLGRFIESKITGRQCSFLAVDLKDNHDQISSQIINRSVLVIGGAGTIGSSFIKSILPYKPAKLTVVDISENGLTELTRDLRSSTLAVPDRYKTYPINFSSPVFSRVLEEDGPYHIVANFAAHKHVRSEKDHISIQALLENNVLQAIDLLETMSKNPPEHFFSVSTDKAANPVSVMGASKKLMEEVLLAYSETMHITTARFANVAFSNGSLLDGWINRMLKKQPLSAPLDIYRYFVSPEEAGHICLLACMMGRSGEIFFPKLERDQLKSFSDIGLDFIRFMGYVPVICKSEEEAKEMIVGKSDKDLSYPIYLFNSETSGEKTVEEFYTSTERIDMDSLESMGIIRNKDKMNISDVKVFSQDVKALFSKANVSKEDLVSFLSGSVSGFSHVETGISLDQKM